MERIVIYDFDGTLTPYSLPKYKVLEECGFVDGMNDEKFISMVKQRSKDEGKDFYSSIIEVYFDILRSNRMKLNIDSICYGTDSVVYNDGVDEFLYLLRSYGVKNYLLSSGFRDFLKKISIEDYFEEIYGTTLNYDKRGSVKGVNLILTDYVKIEKIEEILVFNGFDELDCSDVVYVGDGLTDVPAMEFVKENGGVTIFVYKDPNSKEKKIMEEKGIVTYFAELDFTNNSELCELIKRLCEIDE